MILDLKIYFFVKYLSVVKLLVIKTKIMAKKLELYFITILLLLSGSLGFNYVYAENKIEPVIKTTQTPNGASIMINFPDNYSGRVVTTYDGKEFKTTTTTISPEETKKMRAQMIERQKAIQKLFQEQQKMFDLMWQNFWF